MAQARIVSDSSPEQEQWKEETPAPEDQSHRAPSSLGSAIHSNENEEIVISSIRATDVALGLRRVPAGFYTVVLHSEREWRTENKCSSVGDDVIEWNGLIPIPSDLSATICLEVYASFEFGPMLSAGEQLRKLTITVAQLLDRSTNRIPFTLFPVDGDVVSPCSSVSVTTKRCRCEHSESSALSVLGPQCSTAVSRSKLEHATEQGHIALSRYRKHGQKQDLERSISEFEQALRICPLDHFCRAAALSNLAMAKFILCQVECTDASFNVPLDLYRNALATRPAGHADRPSTLIHLAAVHIARFEKQKDEVERACAEALLYEAIQLHSAESYESRAAAFMLQLPEFGGGPIPVAGKSSVGRDSASRSVDEDPWMLSVRLLSNFERFGDLTDLQRAITILQELVTSASVFDARYRAELANLGVALRLRSRLLGDLSDLEDAISRHRAAVDLTPDGHHHKHRHLNNLGNSFIARFERLGELNDLEEAISKHTAAVELIPLGDPEWPTLLHDLGNSLKARFERLGELNDLEGAISMLKDAGHGHPYQSACLHNLGNAFAIRFQCLKELSDLEDAISRHTDAVVLTPSGHPDKPIYLSSLGSSLLTRFDQLEELRDLEDTISTFSEAVHLTPHGHPEEPGLLNNLGNAFATRFLHFGELSDLENAVSRHRDAVHLIPHGHILKPAFLNNLANSSDLRFQRLGELSDLDDAISGNRDAVNLDPPGHPHKLIHLHDLGSSLITRFRHLGELSDLDDAITRYRELVDLTPHGHPLKPTGLKNLGNAFVIRFEHLGELGNLEDAILRHRNAVDLIPSDHPHKPAYLSSLGNSVLTRFERLGELNDLNESILVFKNVVDLTPQGHPNEPSRLSDLGKSYFTRFLRLSELSDLEYAISTFRGAVDCAAHGQPEKPMCLLNLGSALLVRFEHLGEQGDLEESISLIECAVDFIPYDHAGKPFGLNVLGNSFRARYKRFGNLSDLENAVLIHIDAVRLTPPCHPDKPGHICNLGHSFVTRFDLLGELTDLEEAISRYNDAVELTPDGHPNKHSHLTNLGNAFLTRFRCLGEPSDLEDAISRHGNALNLIPHAHPERPACLTNLGNSFYIRFQHFGKLGDLEDAISRHREVVHLTPCGHGDKAGPFHNLGNSLVTRFERLREPSDLEDGISMLRDAVDFTPPGHTNKPDFLHSLADSYLTRFSQLGEFRDLEDAILMLREAVDLIPHTHTLRPACLTTLGGSLFIRFKRHGELCDLEDAISTNMDAVQLTPCEHPDKPARLSSLGNSLATRFRCLKESSDLEAAISILRNVVDLTPHGHPEEAAGLISLGRSLVMRFECLGEPSDLEEAISLYSRAASTTVSPISIRFDASQKWISCAQRVHHSSLLYAYSTAINLLPQLAWIGLSLTQRYSELLRGGEVVWEAAATALNSGYPETAVEWLEQGRSIVWGELFQLRSSYEDLSSVHPDLAHRLQELSVALEHAGAAREKSLSVFSEHTEDAVHTTTDSLRREVDRHRALAIERDELLTQIRRQPGFEQFLLYKRFSQLREAARSGPVVILNAAKGRCDALIVLANVDHVIHVPLSNFTFEKSVYLQKTLKGFVRRARAIRADDDRDGKVATWDRVTWESFLSPLWKCVVKPVLDALAFSIPGDLSRIFWCPTGPFTFLPIHAAGLYDAEYSHPGHKVFDFVVSSYIPTLSILAPSSNPNAVPSGNLHLLAVRQPHSDGLSRLPGVVTEVELIKQVIENTPSAHTITLEPDVGTVEEVLELMKGADWVHFACHGIQDGVDSGLCLADGRRLKVRDMSGLSRPRGGLAFLSACQTAKGDERLSDEAVHIAAGMLFSGYGGVVGTMWSISDRLAPSVAKDVYVHLFRNGTRPDYREAARALHDAVGCLRESNASFDEWLPFIHVGL